jgi:CBS domain-containing protein
MKVKELMDTNFIDVFPDQDIVEVSLKMEKYKKFTTSVVDHERKLVGWVTSIEIIKGLREGKKLIKDIMYTPKDVVSVNENDAARLAVIKASKYKVISIPVLNDEGKVVGVIRSCDIVETLSQLYEIKVSRIFEAMAAELKGVSWNELMEASAVVTKRQTGERITAKKYEKRIKNTTFGEAIWATGGLEKFFVGLIAIGEYVLARKVARARK